MSPLFSSSFFQGVWRLADPKITLASVASMILGGCLAAHDGPLSWPWLLLTVFGIFCIEAAKNASGEVVDWNSGTDQAIMEEERTPFSGGKRVIVDGFLTSKQAAQVAGAFYLLGAAAGWAIVLWREPSVFWVGVLGLALAIFYHAPPLKLSYRGLGEVAVGTAYGPVIACGTYLVQRHEVSQEVFLASLPLGLAIMLFLWINEFPDARADELAGKRTWVVRLGRPLAAKVFGGLVGLEAAGLLLLPLAGLSKGTWLGLLGLVPAAAAARRLLQFPEDAREIIPAQGWTLLGFLLTALGMGVGALLIP